MKLITPPDDEPVTLAEAKVAARIDGDAHDAILPALITAAREQAEQIAGCALVEQVRRYELRDWPASGVPLPEHGATAVAVSYWTGSAWQSVPGVQFGEVTGGTAIAHADAWPALPDVPARPRVRVDITAGLAAADVATCLRVYIMASVAHWIENPGALTASGKAASNPLFERLLDPLKVYG